MATITLNSNKVVKENSTTKYWREIECNPQTVELKSWSTNHPLFILKGVIVSSHDEKEIGLEKETHIQTYSFWLDEDVKRGMFTINN